MRGKGGRTSVIGVASVMLACAVGPVIAQQAKADDGLAEVRALADAGRFRDAHARIDALLPNADPDRRRALEWERERMRRVRIDFSLDRAGAWQRVQKQIPDLDAREFAVWDRQGLMEAMEIDGERRWFGRSPSNLFRLSAEARARRAQQTPLREGPMESLNDVQRSIRADALASGKANGLQPMRVRVKQGITVEADAVPAGETVRAWIPWPREIPGQQRDIKLLSSSPAKARIAPASTLQRTAYMEAKARAGTPTEFAIEYEVTLSAQYHPIDPDKVQPTPGQASLAPFLVERAPHVVFSDDLRAFSRSVVGDEKNPYRIAQKLFAAVDRIPWAGALEYSTIRNISDYALKAGHADCGQQTLLLITLLRMNAIPARWQSGMVFGADGYDNLHDWGMVYLAPHGWVPMDVTTGRFATQEPGMEWFYLGGLDNWRIAYNDDWSRDFVPAKQHVRSETVDLQRGEVEWKGGNLYFDQWDYHFTATVMPAPAGVAMAHQSAAGG